MKLNYTKMLKEREYSNHIWHVIRALLGAKDFKFEGQSNRENLDITLTVNGVEIDFLEFCDRVTNGVNQDVIRRAKILLDERLNERTNKLYRKLDEVSDALDVFIREGYKELN